MRPLYYFVLDGKISIYKNPGARLLYGVDLATWLANADTTLQNVTASVQGVSLDGSPFIDGSWVCAWITGLDETDGAVNTCTFAFTCTDGKSADSRTIHFLKRPG